MSETDIQMEQNSSKGGLCLGPGIILRYTSEAAAQITAWFKERLLQFTILVVCMTSPSLRMRRGFMFVP